MQWLRPSLAIATLAVLTLLACGCASRTEVIIAVDSDIVGLDQITISVTSPTNAMQSSNATVGTGQPPLPRTLGVTWSSGALGPYTATATGLRAGVALATRTATFSFVQGQTLVVHLDLLARCEGARCSAGQTCGEQLCRPVQLMPNELTPFTGTIDRSPDAGGTPVDSGMVVDMGGARDMSIGPVDVGVDMFVPMPDMGHDVGIDMGVDMGPPDAYVCVAEVCNGLDDDCDGIVDEGFMLQTDPNNCGMCGRVCMLANTTGDTCGGGFCMIGTCNTGFLNCDGRNSTGCEANSTNDPNNCGTCGMRCRGTTPICCRSACAATCP